MTSLPSAEDLEAQLVSRLSAAAPLPLGGGYGKDAEGHDLYEGIAFSAFVLAANAVGATARLVQPDADPAAAIVFRTQPGELDDDQDFTFATIEWEGGPKFELHLGVYVEGASGVRHECDVLLIHAASAAACRDQSRRPDPEEDCVVGLECKFYNPEDSLPLGIGRAAVGVNTDLSQAPTGLVSSADNKSVRRLLKRWRVSYKGKVTAGDSSTLAELDALAEEMLRRAWELARPTPSARVAFTNGLYVRRSR
jgi:hypothetical protein